MVTPQLPLSSTPDCSGSTHVVLLSVGHLVLFAHMFWGPKTQCDWQRPSTASNWWEKPGIEKYVCKQHLSYNQGEVSPQSKNCIPLFKLMTN